MKKRIVLIAAVMIAALLGVMLLAACGPASDPEKAKDNLEEEGYAAEVYDGDGLVMRMALSVFDISNVDKILVGSKYKNDSFEFVTVFYFDSAKDAKNAIDKVKQYAEDKEKSEEKEQKKEEGSVEWVFGTSGKMIWFGTKAAVKASR